MLQLIVEDFKQLLCNFCASENLLCCYQ